MKDNIILDKSFEFAKRIVGLHKFLKTEKKEYIMSQQLLKSGTSIGANVKEAVNAITKKDFVSKMYIAFKEANETEYWLDLLVSTGYLTDLQYNSIMKDCKEICKILNSITKTSKNNNC